MSRFLAKSFVVTATLGAILVPALPASATRMPWDNRPLTPSECAGATVPGVWTPNECKTLPEKQQEACGNLSGFLGNYCRELAEDPKNPFAELSAGTKTLVDAETQKRLGNATGSISEGVQELTGWVFKQIEDSTTVDLKVSWFVDQYHINGALALGLTFFLMIVGVCIGLLKRDPKEMAHPLAGMFEFALMLGALPWLVMLGLAIVDFFGHITLAHVGDQVQRFFTAIRDSSALMPAAKELLAFLATLLVLIGMGLVWATLKGREFLIYISCLIGVFFLMLNVLPEGRKWTKRLMSWIATLAFIKLVVIGVIAFAFSVIGGIKTGTVDKGDLAAAGFLLVGAGISPLWIPAFLAPMLGAVGITRAFRSHHQVSGPLNSGRKHVQGKLSNWHNQATNGKRTQSGNGSQNSANANGKGPIAKGAPLTVASVASGARRQWQRRERVRTPVRGTASVEVPWREDPISVSVPPVGLTIDPTTPMPNWSKLGSPMRRGRGGRNGR